MQKVERLNLIDSTSPYATPHSHVYNSQQDYHSQYHRTNTLGNDDSHSDSDEEDRFRRVETTSPQNATNI